jgi:hypothetical protein
MTVSLGDDNAADDISGEVRDKDLQRMDLISIGKVELNNTRAKELESNKSFLHVMDPMCKLQGMDFFL